MRFTGIDGPVRTKASPSCVSNHKACALARSVRGTAPVIQSSEASKRPSPNHRISLYDIEFGSFRRFSDGAHTPDRRTNIGTFLSPESLSIVAKFETRNLSPLPNVPSSRSIHRIPDPTTMRGAKKVVPCV
jgi:hypothetical protein